MCELFAFRGDHALKQAPESFVAALTSHSVACHLENLDDGLWLVLYQSQVRSARLLLRLPIPPIILS